MYQWRVATESDWFRFNVHLGQPRVQVETPPWTYEIYFWFGVVRSSYATRTKATWVVLHLESAMLKRIEIHSKFIRTTSNFDDNLHKVDQTICDSVSPPIVANAFSCCQLFSPTMLLQEVIRYIYCMLQEVIVGLCNVTFKDPAIDRSTVTHHYAPYPSCQALVSAPCLS